MTMNLRSGKTHLWLFALLVFSLIPSSVKAVSIIADSPCDEQYYESLAARAWLEAQREITQNQNIILKPDSVFEYTCFDRLVDELANHAEQMLSETSAYGSPLGNTSMDTALQNLVGVSLISHISANFGYYPGLLGGHTAASGIKHTPAAINGGTVYSCDIMERVWKAAKCINFITDADNDGFYTFQEYSTSTDKRHLPTACAAIAGNWTSNINTALTIGPWSHDPLQTYIAETTSQNCAAGACACTGQPIPTGVEVTKADPVNVTYDEKVCLQPGCRYHPGGFPLSSTVADPGAGCYGR